MPRREPLVPPPYATDRETLEREVEVEVFRASGPAFGAFFDGGWWPRGAGALRARGGVRTRRDGTVEAVVQGSPDAVEAITRWARHGPEDARVQGVEISDAEGDFPGFEKRRSF